MTAICDQDMVWIRQRAKATGVPSRLNSPILALFAKWANKSGIEWAITRFKSIKNDFVRMNAGLEPCSSWIKRSRNSTTWFGGDIGALERWTKEREKRFPLVLALLNVYTNFYAQEPSKAQVKKFLTAVNAPKIKVPEAVKRAVLEGMRISRVKPARKLAPAKPLLAYFPSETKWAPTPFGRKAEEEGIVDSVAYLAGPAGRSHYMRYREYYDPVLEGLENEYSIGNIFVPTNPLAAPIAGRIGLIQEAGFKLRSVANPGRVFQQVLSPLGDSLFNRLKDLPWDCTFDQSKADSTLCRLTQEQNKTIHSVDLSNATDYFPLELQAVVLYALYPLDSGLVNLFQEVSRFDWECNLPDEDLVQYGFAVPGRVRWTQGQPLGLYPSFASFALTHGLLLLGLLGREWDEDFFILGDDVVILNDELYVRYIQCLDSIGCPVSSQKTISSNVLAEFHSTVFAHGTLVPNYKWRKPSDDSFLDVLRNTGPRLTPFLRPRQRKVVGCISQLPEDLGGLGWNPKGLSYEDRIDPWISYLIREKQGLAFLTDYTGLLRRLLWQSDLVKITRKVGVSSNEGSPYFETFDQKVISYVHRFLGSFMEPLRELVGQNLANVVVDSNIDLPIPGVRGLRRSTALERWETILVSYHPQVSESRQVPES